VSGQVQIDVHIEPPSGYDVKAARQAIDAIAAARAAGEPVVLPGDIEPALDMRDSFLLQLSAVQLGVVQVNADGSMIVQGTFVVPPDMFAFQGKRAIVGPNGQPAIDTSTAFQVIPGKAPGLPRLLLLCRASGTVGELSKIVAQERVRWGAAEPPPAAPSAAREGLLGALLGGNEPAKEPPTTP
jgi:hypothetical protein